MASQAIEKRAFTLIESLMLVVVVAILAIVATARIVDMSSMRQDFAVRKLKADIHYAQSLALSIQKRTGLFFNETSDSYFLSIEETPPNWTQAQDPLTHNAFTMQFNNGDFQDVAIEQVYFNGNDLALVFDKWGNPYSYDISTDTAVVLANPAGVQLTGPVNVSVERGSGRVYIQ